MLARVVFYIFVYAALLAGAAVLLWQTVQWIRRKAKGPGIKIGPRPKKGLGVWTQVYDTNSWEEIQALQAHLEEEEIECFVYEQGRRDIHGNFFKGFGIAVPKTSVGRTQKIIARMPA